MLNFTVRGEPTTQGSKSGFAIRRKGADGNWEYTGGVAMVEGRRPAAREAHKTWREAVKSAAIEAMADDPAFPLHGPLTVAMIFTFSRPPSHYRTGKNAHLVRNGAPPYPFSRPDLVKLARSTEDAMTDAGVYRDDSQIVRYRTLGKVYVGHPAAMRFPGVWVTVAHMPGTTSLGAIDGGLFAEDAGPAQLRVVE